EQAGRKRHEDSGQEIGAEQHADLGIADPQIRHQESGRSPRRLKLETGGRTRREQHAKDDPPAPQHRNTLKRDEIRLNRHRAFALCLSMISEQTLRVCRGKTASDFSGSCSGINQSDDSRLTKPTLSTSENSDSSSS